MRNLARYPKSADRDRPWVIPYPENVISFQESRVMKCFHFFKIIKSSGPWENPKNKMRGGDVRFLNISQFRQLKFLIKGKRGWEDTIFFGGFFFSIFHI